MKRRISGTTATALACGLLAAAAATAQVNRVILRVNDEIATLYDYETLKRQQLGAIAQSQLPEERKQEMVARIGVDTMRQLFEEMLLLSRAEQLGVEVPNSAVEAAVRNSMAGFGIDSLEDFDAALRRQGMTLLGWTEQMRRNMVSREVMGREIRERVTLEEEDLRRYYRANAEDFRRQFPDGRIASIPAAPMPRPGSASIRRRCMMSPRITRHSWPLCDEHGTCQ